MDIEKEKTRERMWNIIWGLLFVLIVLGFGVIYFIYRDYSDYDDDSPKFKKLREALKTMRAEKDSVRKLKEKTVDGEDPQTLKNKFVSIVEDLALKSEALKNISVKRRKVDYSRDFSVVGWAGHIITTSFDGLNSLELATLLRELECTWPFRSRKISLESITYNHTATYKTAQIEFVIYERIQNK